MTLPARSGIGGDLPSAGAYDAGSPSVNLSADPSAISHSVSPAEHWSLDAARTNGAGSNGGAFARSRDPSFAAKLTDIVGLRSQPLGRPKAGPGGRSASPRRGAQPRRYRLRHAGSGNGATAAGPCDPLVFGQVRGSAVTESSEFRQQVRQTISRLVVQPANRLGNIELDWL